MCVQTINDAIDGIRRIDNDLSQGHVSVQEASQAVADINKTCDDFAGNCDRLGIDFSSFVKNQDVFDAFGGIKQGSVTGMQSVSSFFTAVDSFKGSWRNPEQARKKLEDGLRQIAGGVTSLGNTLNNIKRTGTGISNILGIGRPLKDSITGQIVLDPITGKPIMEHPVLNGIGNFGTNIAGFGTAFARSGIIDLAGRVTESISKAVNGNRQEGITGGAASLVSNNDTTSNNNGIVSNNSNNSLQRNFKESKSIDSDDFSADMINEINVIIDGSASSQNSMCSINGENYRLSNYSLSQELLQPMILTFGIEKETKIETQSDVIFADITQIIGKSFEINISTIKTSQEDSDTKPQKAFVLKGMIIDVSASRATASTQSANVTVATWDALLQNAPHCRSFENMTLKEIIESVIKPYSDIESNISPRFKDKIPYIVQYNQSDYAFISMLAIRFGEWMYNTGERFVFGEMDNTNSTSVNLEYPGGSLMSYNLHQYITSFSFNHLLPNHYLFGKDDWIQRKSATGMADGNGHDWTGKAFNASVQRFKNEQIAALDAGGFDDGKNNEGAESILDYSLKIEAQGKKTGIMTVQGFSKLAMLKIGQIFLIRDNVQNKSGESQDVEQKALKIVGINHSFDYKQEYSNYFTAIPVACNYPSYSDANICPFAPQQRAKVVDNKDEQKLGRIRVQFPWQEVQSKDMKSPWLRIAVPYAGMDKGHQFIPEIGEEVIVGFEMNNAERPYIIGALYNGGEGKADDEWAVSKEENGTTNNIKAIRTRNGHTILFNDRGDAGLIEIYDNNNNTYHITLSADDKKITIYSAGNIEINADGSISMTAKNNVNIKANSNVSVNADRDVSIQASKVKVR